MTGPKRVDRALGSIFDVAALSAIPDDDCHVLIVSGRSLYLMQHFANNEVNWLARYVDEYIGELYYQPVTLDSPNVDFVQRVAQDYRLEVNDLNCAEIIASVDNLAAQVGLINVNLQGAVGCGCDGEQFDPESLSVPAIPGEGYLDDKCRVANVLHDRIRNLASTVDTIGLNNWVNLGVGTATALVAALVAAGPAGWGTLLVLGVVSGIVLLVNELSAGAMGALVTELDENQDDLVCALYSSLSAQGAREAYIAVLDGQGVNAIVQEIVEFMLTNSVTNELFQSTGSYLDGGDWLNDNFVPTDCLADCGIDQVVFGRLLEFPDANESGGSGSLVQNGSSRVLTATQDENGFWYVAIKNEMYGSTFSCNYTGITMGEGGGRGWAWYTWNGTENVLDTEAGGSQDPMPIQNLGAVSAVVWIGAASFTVTVTLN